MTPLPINDEKITLEELNAAFGETLPIEAVNLMSDQETPRGARMKLNEFMARRRPHDPDGNVMMPMMSEDTTILGEE